MNTLSLLAETSPRVYHDALASGNTVINNLYNQCLADNLTNLRTGDDLEQLFAVFDVALDHGLGLVVLQYASQVGWALVPASARQPNSYRIQINLQDFI